jgi:MFS family permease
MNKSQDQTNKFNEIFWPFFILTYIFWIDLGIIPSLPDLIIKDLNLNNISFGLLGASTFLIAGLASLFTFKLIISQKIKYLVIISILLFSLFQILFALISNQYLRFLMRFLIGLPYSMIWSI